MINAKEELEFQLKDGAEIEAAEIQHDGAIITLRVNHTEQELANFWKNLDFTYDDGYGGQELYGVVWIKNDPGWLERGEYDGSEWWEYSCKPMIPDYLK